nr:nucleocapsid protein [Red mite quaranjavirus]
MALSKPGMKRLNAQGDEMAGRSRGDPMVRDLEAKAKATAFVWVIYDKVLQTFKFDRDHLSHGMAATKQMMSLHTAVKQKMSGQGKVFKKWIETPSINLTIHGTSFTANTKTLLACYVETQEEFDFVQRNRGEWQGSVTQIMALWDLFTVRFDEQMMTPGGITKERGKDGSPGAMWSFTSLGVGQEYKQGCSGAGWPVPIRSALAQSLGPVTQACLLSISKDDVYANKWEEAVKRTWAHIREIDQIAAFLRKNSPMTNASVIAGMCVLYAFTGARKQTRLAFPPNWLHIFYQLPASETESMDIGTREPKIPKETTSAKALTMEEICIKYKLNRPYLHLVDYSGTGGFSLWHACAKLAIVVNATNSAAAQQMMTMAMGGYYVEDLGVLAFQFGKTAWLTRKEVEPTFREMRNASPAVQKVIRVAPLVPKYWGKLSSSIQTNLMQGGRRPIGCEKSASQKRIVYIKDELRNLTTRGSEGVALNDSLSIVNYLQKEVDKIKDQLQGRTSMEVGTLRWRQWGFFEKNDDGYVDDVAHESGSIFWGQ